MRPRPEPFIVRPPGREESERVDCRGIANETGEGRLIRVLVAAALAALAAALSPPTAAAYPSYPAPWLREAACIHGKEVFGHVGRPDEWTVVGGGRGGYQFLLSTWRRVGGRGAPEDASPAEQTYRAWRVYVQDRRSWREWTTAPACGLR